MIFISQITTMRSAFSIFGRTSPPWAWSRGHSYRVSPHGQPQNPPSGPGTSLELTPSMCWSKSEENNLARSQRRRQYLSSRELLSVAGLARLGLLGCVGLAACAPASWDKPGATQADYDRDIRECQRLAQQGALYSFAKPVTAHKSFKQCMTARGYVHRD
jgi:hypothetical protein